jgi:hypothetical protein
MAGKIEEAGNWTIQPASITYHRKSHDYICHSSRIKSDIALFIVTNYLASNFTAGPFDLGGNATLTFTNHAPQAAIFQIYAANGHVNDLLQGNFEVETAFLQPQANSSRYSDVRVPPHSSCEVVSKSHVLILYSM